jgi:hypothetical protein
MKVTMTTTVLHPRPVDPEAEETYRDEMRSRGGRQPGPLEFQYGSFAHRFEEGQTYEVDTDTGNYLKGQGWANVAARGTSDEELSEPVDTREVSDDEADRIEREVHAPAREAANVETVRYIGTGSREVVGTGEQDVHEGDNVRVVNLGQGGDTGTDGTTLDVQDSESGQGSDF